MNSYDFGGRAAQTYTKVCDCGRTIDVSTQQDRYPEYTTLIFVKCVCGNSVEFKLPVN